MSDSELYPHKTKGAAFFILALVVYSFQTMGIKCAMSWYDLST